VNNIEIDNETAIARSPRFTTLLRATRLLCVSRDLINAGAAPVKDVTDRNVGRSSRYRFDEDIVELPGVKMQLRRALLFPDSIGSR